MQAGPDRWIEVRVAGTADKMKTPTPISFHSVTESRLAA
jgi:hypothetical protein